jgi:hypothetical protein
VRHTCATIRRKVSFMIALWPAISAQGHMSAHSIVCLRQPSICPGPGLLAWTFGGFRLLVRCRSLKCALCCHTPLLAQTLLICMHMLSHLPLILSAHSTHFINGMSWDRNPLPSPVSRGHQPCAAGWQPWQRATIRKGRPARSWDQGANNPGRNASAHPKNTSAFGAEMCGVGAPISDASTGRANAL